MTKRQALKALKSQKLKLSKPVGLIWNTQTLAYMEKIFGKESEQYRMFSGFRGISIESKDYDACVERLKILFDNWVEDVRNGLMKSEEETMFQKRLYQSLAFVSGAIALKVIENAKDVYTWLQQLFHK